MVDNDTINATNDALFGRGGISVPQQDIEAQSEAISDEDMPSASPALPSSPSSPPQPPPPSPQYDWRSNLRESLACFSAIAVPLILLSLLLIPAVIIVAVLLGICIVPVIVIVCAGCCFYFLAPETSSTFALLWGSSQNRRWDMDWSLSNYMDSVELRSREDLEKSLIVKKVVSSENADIRDPKGKKDAVNGENTASKSAKNGKELGRDETDEKEKTIESNTKETNVSSLKEVEHTIASGCVQTEAKDHQSIKKQKNKRKKPIRFSAETMIRLDQINKSCCDICMAEYELGDFISESKNPDCAHIFHKDCILDWMQKKHTCPCCRRNYLGEAEEQVSTPGWIENL